MVTVDEGERVRNGFCPQCLTFHLQASKEQRAWGYGSRPPPLAPVGRFHVKRKVSFRRWPHLLPSFLPCLPPLLLPPSFSTRTRTKTERTNGGEKEAAAQSSLPIRTRMQSVRRFRAKSRSLRICHKPQTGIKHIPRMRLR